MRAKAIGGLLIRSVTLGLVAVQIGVTAIYSGPPTPIKLAVQPYLDVWDTFFFQDWRLFSPDPVDSDEALLARCHSEGESSAWYDLSAPLWKRFQGARLSPGDYLARPHQESVQAFQLGDTTVASWREACQRGSTAACSEYEARMARSRGTAERVLARIGSAFCRDIDSDGRYTHVSLRSRSREATPWSQRGSGQRPEVGFAIGTYPIDRTISHPGIYSAAPQPSDASDAARSAQEDHDGGDGGR